MLYSKQKIPKIKLKLLILPYNKDIFYANIRSKAYSF